MTCNILILRMADKDGQVKDCGRWLEVHEVTDEAVCGFWLDSGQSDSLPYDDIDMAVESKYRLQVAINNL